jgi:predicted nucleotide-binding protein
MDNQALKERLETLIAEGQQFNYESIDTPMDYIDKMPPEWDVWVRRVSNIIKNSFEGKSAPYMLVNNGENLSDNLQGHDEPQFNHAKATLIKALEEGLKVVEKDLYGEMLRQHTELSNHFDPRQIFIVHGHNHEAKNELEIFIKEIGLDPIVLHRKPDEGQTLIEKFEKHSKVGYAIILLTPDDVVHSSEKDKEERRARQNVIFEFGYFVGMLTRKRVCCLYQENVTLPSDVSGLIYKPFKSHIEEVKYALIKELKSAGYQTGI